MDLNKDGNLDILSGSYDSYSQRNSGGMLGEFHVFHGNGDGTYQKSKVMQNRGGKSLAIDVEWDNICTRPYAVDLNGDGHLDLVAGNKKGKFYLFPGAVSGQYSDSSTELKGLDGQPLKVEGHADPFFVDWDGDGDQDMLSGSFDGGVYFFENVGDQFSPAFAKQIALVEPYKLNIQLHSSGVTRSQTFTRVTAVDYNQDGKLDLLVGDVATVYSPAEGLSDAQCMEQLAQWQPKWDALTKENEEKGLRGMKKYESESPLLNRQYEIVSGERGGFVWVYLQK